MTGQDSGPGLPPHLSRILEQDYPRFSEVEMRRRRELLEAAMGEADVGPPASCPTSPCVPA